MNHSMLDLWYKHIVIGGNQIKMLTYPASQIETSQNARYLY